MPESTLTNAGLSLESLRRRLPGYRVERVVGNGAMGIVVEAVQAGLGRRVAVKVLPPNLALRERTVKRFLREAEAMGRLAHPSIVDVFEVGSLEDLHYFSMKFVEGPPLDRVLRAGPLAIDDVVRLGVDVADALAHAHSRGVLHRDVKPANLLRDGARVVLTDFGLARPIDTADAGSMTESGDLVGTPLYMAPDQISGDAEKIDGRTDIWGLGVTLYELLTGRPPFGGPNAQAILHAILHKDPPLLRKLRDDVPRDLEAVILKCLEKDPARRYTTAANLRDDLLALQRGEAVSAARPRFFDPALRWLRRHPAEGGVLGSVLFVALLLGSYLRATSRQLKTETSAREEAESQKDEALSQQVDYVLQKLEIWARYELLEVRNQFSEAKLDPEREEASERLADVLEQIPFDTCPDVAAEAIELLAAWNQARGVDDAQVLERVEQGAGRDPKLRLMLRAAALAGQGHTDQALLLHRERARLDPADPAPPYDAARLLRRMALAERKADLEARCVALLADALGLLGGAVDLAVAAGDTAALLRILTERARCLIAVEHHDAAHADLDVVLARDPTYFEAFSLRLFCERAQRRREAPPPASSAQPPSTAAVEGLDEEQAPALSIERLLPGREDLTEELQSAGRGLQSIYRGLHDLLRSTVEPADQQAEDDEPDAGDPEQGEPQRGSTGG